MLPSQSGNDLKHQSYAFTIEEQSQIGEARRFALVFCDKLNFDETRRGRVSIIVTELGSNLIKYAKNGQLIIRIIDRPEAHGLEILSIDRGPGIQNPAEALVDGFTTGSSPGTGLGAIKRQSDEFDIYSVLNEGSIIFSTVYATDDVQKSPYEIGAISVPMKGETTCGDAWCVHEMKSYLSIIMVDGLGHGPKAHEAAQEAVAEFKKDTNLILSSTLTEIHKRLRGTRGGAVYLSNVINMSEIEYASLGNIRAVIQTPEKIVNLISQNGTAGVRIPSLKIYKQEWSGDGFLILHSDGINSRWNLLKYPGLMQHHAAILAAVLYRDFNRGNDDSTILVVRGNR